VIPIGGAYPLDAFSLFSGTATWSRDNVALSAAIAAAAGKTLRAGDGPYDFDTYPAGIDSVHIEGSPFANFTQNALPMFNGIFTGNKRAALIAAVLRYYANTENIGSKCVNG